MELYHPVRYPGSKGPLYTSCIRFPIWIFKVFPCFLLVPLISLIWAFPERLLGSYPGGLGPGFPFPGWPLLFHLCAFFFTFCDLSLNLWAFLFTFGAFPCLAAFFPAFAFYPLSGDWSSA